MQTLKRISIPEPCHQSWQQMTPVINGRHCESCCKVVTDFTKMTNAEIIQYLSKNTDVCGRFEKYQVNSINSQLDVKDLSFPGIFKRTVLAMGLLWSSIYYKASAQTGAPMAQTIADSSKQRCQSITLGKIATPQYREISGVIIDGADNTPIPGATIHTLNGIQTATDANGNFKIRVPITTTKFMISFIGYDTQTVNIDPAKLNYSIKLNEASHNLGGVMVQTYIRPPFFKRIYYKFIKRPIHKIFKG